MLTVLDGSPADVARHSVRGVLADHAVVPDVTVLSDLYVEGAAAGVKAATRAVHQLHAGKADDGGGDVYAVDQAEWDAWSPGDVATARRFLSGAAPGSEMRALLDEAGVTIQSVADHRLDALARTIASGIEQGASISDVTDVVAEVLDDPSAAEMVARTETTRAMTAAAYDSYRSLGVEWISFLTAEDTRVDQDCADNEDRGPIPAWDRFPNGDPPVHPNCRCTIVPAFGPDL